MGNVAGYQLEDQLGTGTYGTVFRGVQNSTGQDVAVKVLRAAFPPLPAAVTHPYLVPVLDASPGTS